MNWVKILVYILILIVEGLSQTDATRKAAQHFGVSIDEILKHL